MVFAAAPYGTVVGQGS